MKRSHGHNVNVLESDIEKTGGITFSIFLGINTARKLDSSTTIIIQVKRGFKA